MPDLPVQSFPEDSSPTEDDVIHTVNDPAGTPADKFTSLATLRNQFKDGGNIPLAHDDLGPTADEHIAHSGVSISTPAGSGLSGGGDITTTRSLSLDINSLTEDTLPDPGEDFLVTYDASTGTYKKVRFNFFQPTRRIHTQASHGFSVTDPIGRTSGGDWIKADADQNNFIAAVGICTLIVDADNFVIAVNGYQSVVHSLTQGTPYYVAVGGGLTATPPAPDDYAQIVCIPHNVAGVIVQIGPPLRQCQAELVTKQKEKGKEENKK